jgi:hypothetical protein
MSAAPRLGELLQIAEARLDNARYARPSPGTGLEETVRQLARLTAALSSYLAIVVPDDASGLAAATSEQPFWQAARELKDALRLATGSLTGWAGGTPEAAAPEPGTRAWHLARAAETLTAGHDLLQTHFSTTPQGLRTRRTWWARVLESPQVSEALVREIARVTRLTACHIAQLTATGSAEANDGHTPALTALAVASQWLWRGTSVVHAAHTPTTETSTDRMVLHSIPSALMPGRIPPQPGEPDAVLYAGIGTSAERLRHLASGLPDTVRWPGAVNGDAWAYTATAAAIACDISKLAVRHLTRTDGQEPPALPGEVLLSAADAAARACNAWKLAAAEWKTFRTDGPGIPTAAMTEIGDLVLRLGRLTFDDPAWTPGRGTQAPLRDLTQPARADTLVPVIHQTADALAHMAAGDLAAMIAASHAGRLYARTRSLPAAGTVRKRFTKISPAQAVPLRDAYELAISATGTLARHLDAIAVTRSAPAVILARARAIAPVTCDLIQPGHQDAAHPAGRPRITGQTTRPQSGIPSGPAPRLMQSRLSRVGVNDPGLLMRAAAIDRAAAAVTREALGAISPDRQGRHGTDLPEQARAIAGHGTAGDGGQSASAGMTAAGHPRRDGSRSPAGTARQRHRDRSAGRGR